MSEWVCLSVLAAVFLGLGWLFSPWGEAWLEREQTKRSVERWDAERRARAAERRGENTDG